MPSMTRTNYSGYRVLDRDALLSDLRHAGITPAFDRVVAEHVTYRYPDPAPAPDCGIVTVVGHARGDGVEAVLVAVDGSTIRPDGGRFHITLSLAPGHKPAESNRLLSTGLVTALEPITVAVESF